MKSAVFTLIAVFLLAGTFGIYSTVATAQDEAGTGSSTTADDQPGYDVYTCPMTEDNFFTTDPDAKCPTCNMNVESVDELYVCPDHPDEFSVDPDAVCAETGHAYEPVEELYVCPMHPDEISTDPDAVCDICGMNLIPQVPGDDPDSMVSNCPRGHMMHGCCAGN
jgi:hypothetical protein